MDACHHRHRQRHQNPEKCQWDAGLLRCDPQAIKTLFQSHCHPDERNTDQNGHLEWWNWKARWTLYLALSPLRNCIVVSSMMGSDCVVNDWKSWGEMMEFGDCNKGLFKLRQLKSACALLLRLWPKLWSIFCSTPCLLLLCIRIELVGWWLLWLCCITRWLLSWSSKCVWPISLCSKCAFLIISVPTT